MRYRLRIQSKNSLQMAPQAFREQQVVSSSSFRSFHTQYLPSEHSADTGGDTSVQELVSDEKPSQICTSKQETDYTKLW